MEDLFANRCHEPMEKLVQYSVQQFMYPGSEYLLLLQQAQRLFMLSRQMNSLPTIKHS